MPRRRRPKTLCRTCGRPIKFVRRPGTTESIAVETRMVGYVPDVNGLHEIVTGKGEVVRARLMSDGLLGYTRHHCG